MIIYGSKAVHLKTVQSKTTCPNCGNEGSLVISIFRRHAHLFWIPLFPIGKIGVSQCQHCKQVLQAKEMPELIRREYDNLKSETKGPIWQFAGLGIIALLIVWVNYTSGEEKKMQLEYLASPQEGDVYEYKVEESGNYSTLKIVDVSGDSVFVSPNEYEINKITQIHKIDKAENYSDLYYGISKSDVRKMFDSGEILDVNR